MKKTLFILAIALFGAGVLSAQPMKGFVSGGISESTTIDASFGMPIAGIAEKHTLALPYSHLLRKDFGDVTVMGGTSYTTDPAYFVFDPALVADEGKHNTYVPMSETKKLDVTAKINLIVIPCSTGADVTIGSNTYETLPLQGASGRYYCWTKTNLKEDVNGATAYDGDDNYITNDPTYGYLYTWYGAVGLTTDGSASTVAPATKSVTVGDNDYTYVQGICPEGWHIPTATEKTDLISLDVATVNHPTLWQGTHETYTNSTGFTALPAGIYNAALSRYEGIGTQTDWWTDNGAAAATSEISVIEFDYYCTTPMNKTQNANNGLSVRCVKDIFAE